MVSRSTRSDNLNPEKEQKFMKYLEDLSPNYKTVGLYENLMSSSRLKLQTLEELLYLDFLFDLRVNNEDS